MKLSIHNIAQLLLINSEVFKSNGLNGKMPLVYFFFNYGAKYSKQQYSELAFEILEDVLMEELSAIEKHTGEANSKIASIGWSLIQFIENGYFESDDLEDILELIDNSAQADFEILIEKDIDINNLSDFIIHGHYILERVKLLKNNNPFLLKLNEALQSVLLKLDENYNLIINSGYLNHLLYIDFLKKSKPDSYKEFNHIKAPKVKETKENTFSSLINNKSYEVGIIFNELYFRDTELYKKNKLIVLKQIENDINKLMKSLLNKTNDYSLLFSKLIIQAIFLCRDNESKDQNLFLLGLFNNLK
ncbi:hypothetical protein [Flavivirga spongiicola]|uniref:Uncharacterized protein n=1 Tax=Flavivirga spongiicola TaxID=421621 RepID=A0ABU7XVJ2_9FLAO|nr:hypothetical protein [Flavivirga sp. MEBiC05379]MDO5979795.1 hypothetical protein [Flavivirga sp. MEBiC05379]